MTKEYKRKTISADEFKRIRTDLGLSRDHFAQEIGLNGTQKTNYKVIDRIESGITNASLPMAKLVWMIGQHGLPIWPNDLLADPARDDGEIAS